MSGSDDEIEQLPDDGQGNFDAADQRNNTEVLDDTKENTDDLAETQNFISELDDDETDAPIDEDRKNLENSDEGRGLDDITTGEFPTEAQSGYAPADDQTETRDEFGDQNLSTVVEEGESAENTTTTVEKDTGDFTSDPNEGTGISALATGQSTSGGLSDHKGRRDIEEKSQGNEGTQDVPVLPASTEDAGEIPGKEERSRVYFKFSAPTPEERKRRESRAKYEELSDVEDEIAKNFAEQMGLTEKYDTGEEEEDEEVIRDANLLISGPKMSEKCTLSFNMLEFSYSYGYDCSKPFNLCVLDPDTILFTAGNMLHFFRPSDNTMTFRRSSSGMGIGHVTKHPNLPHFAIGEKGIEPHIIILEWPSLSLVALLRHGTRRSYSHLDYSPTGELLCAQGGSPDYLFTVWNWKRERILLRTRSSNTDVYNCLFSKYMPGHITTGGAGHIKFWKMSKTFTGLKLQGEVGRFGKTEVSDVTGFYAMPDEKVVSGCDWGNILVWEAGLIKFQVTRKNRQPCHEGAITQFEFQNGELMTAGKAGFVKSWYYETIDNADPPDEDRFVEVEPMFELEVADHLGAASILSMARVNPTIKGDNSWYAQDSNGGLWLLNLSMTSNTSPPKRLYCCHSGQVKGIDTSPSSGHFASLDGLGRLHLWEIETNRLLAIKVMAFPGSSLLWLPENVAPCRCVVLAGLTDGGIRAIAVNVAAASEAQGAAIMDPSSGELFTLIQFIKPHTAPIVLMDINADHQFIATASEDLTVFILAVQPSGEFSQLIPIGYIRLPSIPTFLHWSSKRSYVLLIGCEKGELLEVTIPKNPTHNTSVSFEFTEAVIRSFTTKSIKSQILRDIYLAQEEERKKKRLEEKKIALENLRKDNPGIEIDAEQFLADSEAEEVLPPLYIPPVPDKITGATSDPSDPDCVWVVLSGYDSGYRYRYRFGKNEPEKWLKLMDTGEEEVSSVVMNASRTLIFCGLADGRVCVGNLDSAQGYNQPTEDYWSIGMHDGKVLFLKITYDEKYLISVGEDVNIFSYKLHPPHGQQPAAVTPAAHSVKRFVPPPESNDAYALDEPSLEQASAKKEHDRKTKEAQGRKQHVEHILWLLGEKFNKLKRRNRALPSSQRLSRQELELDPRITEDLINTIEEDTNNVRQRYEYALEKARLRYKKLDEFFTKTQSYDTIVVKAIKKNASVRTIRNATRGEYYDTARLAIERKLQEARRKSSEESEADGNTDRALELSVETDEGDSYVPIPPTAAESFLRGITAFESRFSDRLRRLLEKYQSRAAKKERRRMEWMQFMAKMPNMKQNDPEDEARIAEAERTIGDYRLKSGSDYKVPKHMVVSTVTKTKELLDARYELDVVLCSFNDAVLELHKKKLKLIEKLNRQMVELKQIRQELQPRLHKSLPTLPTLEDEKDSNKTAHLRFNPDSVEKERNGYLSDKTKIATTEKTVSTKEHPFANDPMAEILLAFSPQLIESSDFPKVLPCEDSSEEIPNINLIESGVDLSVLQNLAQSADMATPFEAELRMKRLLTRYWEQNTIINDMNKSMSEFDEEVEEMGERRLIAQRDATLLRLRILTLHQELIIIKACESREDFLSTRVAERRQEKRVVNQQISSIQNRVDNRAKGLLRCQDRVKRTTAAFFEAVGDNPYKDYLRRIFKKKYKPPKDDDATSSEDSTSTSEEEDEEADAASVDSKEIQAIRLDENIRPAGCPEELFDLAHTLRTERHDTEREMAGHQKVADSLKRELDSCNKKLKVIEEALQTNQNDLESFQREKQQRLNEVDTTIVIRLSQMKHVKPDGTFIPMKDTLVFDTSMLNYLGKRAGQLHVEAGEQRERHRKNRRHLHRMVKDLRYMETRLKTLKDDIISAQYSKFGQLVKLEDIEAALLRRFIFEMRLNADEIRKDFLGLIKNIKATVRQRYDDLIEVIENNTDLQNLLLGLTEERNKLFLRNEATTATLSRPAAGMIDEDEFQEDIAQLRKLVREMCERRNDLLAEVCRLRQKGTAPPTPPPMDSDIGPPGYHATCVSRPRDKPPPWPPRTILGFDKLRMGSATAPTERPKSPSPKIASMWEQLMEDLGVQGQTYWPEHSDPTERQKLSVETIGEAFVFKTLHDLPPVHEEEILAAKFTNDADAPRFTVVGDDVIILAEEAEEIEEERERGTEEEDTLADAAEATIPKDTEETRSERLESSEELFRRISSHEAEAEGAVSDLLEMLSAATPSGRSERSSERVSIKIDEEPQDLDLTNALQLSPRDFQETEQNDEEFENWLRMQGQSEDENEDNEPDDVN